MWSLPGRLRNQPKSSGTRPGRRIADLAGAARWRTEQHCCDGCTPAVSMPIFRFMTQRIVGLKDRRNQNGLGRRALGFCVVRVVAERSSNRWGRGRKSRLCDALRL